MDEQEIRDIAVIGGGPTGLFAAFYAGMRGASCRIIDALPASLTIAEVIEMKHQPRTLPWLDKVVGDGPWGLCHLVVLRPTPAADTGG